jgi:hypothetical protein
MHCIVILSREPSSSARARISTIREAMRLFDAFDVFSSQISYTDMSCVRYLDSTRSQRRLDARDIVNARRPRMQMLTSRNRHQDRLSISGMSMTFCNLVCPLPPSLNLPLLSGILAQSRVAGLE